MSILLAALAISAAPTLSSPAPSMTMTPHYVMEQGELNCSEADASDNCAVKTDRPSRDDSFPRQSNRKSRNS